MSEQKPSVGRIVLTERDEQRFRAKVGLPEANGCQPWLVSCDADGYGQFRLGRRTVKAHQVAWWLAYGEFPPGLEPDHTCETRHCTSVDHLEWVTHEENNRRIALRSDRCRAGLHRWDEQEPIMRGRGRECRPCRNAGKARRYVKTGGMR